MRVAGTAMCTIRVWPGSVSRRNAACRVGVGNHRARRRPWSPGDTHDGDEIPGVVERHAGTGVGATPNETVHLRRDQAFLCLHELKDRSRELDLDVELGDQERLHSLASFPAQAGEGGPSPVVGRSNGEDAHRLGASRPWVARGEAWPEVQGRSCGLDPCPRAGADTPGSSEVAGVCAETRARRPT